jgi:tRNA(Glu) U13 pseudouridine synthase TruD
MEKDDRYRMALSTLSYAQRSFYVHAYQSLVFNKMASYRFRQHGLKVVHGDLIELENGTIEVVDENSLLTYHTHLHKVVLPLPGNSDTIKYPKNDVGVQYLQCLKDDGIQCVDSRLPGLGSFGKGGYRRFLVKPEIEFEYDQDASSVSLQFALSAGSFATVCIREIMKTSI